jgi:hypothetical protein
VVVNIAMPPELQRVVDASQAAAITGDLTFLVNDYGQPFAKAGFGNKFRDWCIQAGVPGRGHGLRKAAAVRVADNRVTVDQMKAIFGWRSMSRRRSAAPGKRRPLICLPRHPPSPKRERDVSQDRPTMCLKRPLAIDFIGSSSRMAPRRGRQQASALNHLRCCDRRGRPAVCLGFLRRVLRPARLAAPRRPLAALAGAQSAHPLSNSNQEGEHQGRTKCWRSTAESGRPRSTT